MPVRTAVLLQTHFLDAPTANLFAALDSVRVPGHEARVLMHVSPGTPKPAALERLPHHFVTTPEVRLPAYAGKSAGGDAWRIWRGGHPDLITLAFWRAHPDFDRYWVIEYDVRFSGRWDTLLAAFADNDADFLSTSLRRRPDQPLWPYWDSLRAPGDRPPPDGMEQLCAFTPIYRVSAAGMAAMDRAYRAGWSGHIEVAWPSLIRAAGLTVEDLGGQGPFVAPANRGRFYFNTPLTQNMGPGSLVFRPARTRAGRQRDLLWHPVKPFSAKLREDLRLARGRWTWRLRRAAALLRRLIGGPAPGVQTQPARPAAAPRRA